MLESIKLALRIKNDAYDLEIIDLIASAKKDMSISGVKIVEETDALIKRAITMYAKANFGVGNDESEKWQKAYNALKEHLALAGDYDV